MGMETTPPIMSKLNPNASAFVPAPRPVVREEVPAVSVAVPVAVATDLQEYTAEWWSRILTDKAFRDQYVANLSFQSAEQRNALLDELDELADLDQFNGYQEHLADLEEEEILARNLQELDCFLDEELRLTDTNNNVKYIDLPREMVEQEQKQSQQKVPWSKNRSSYQNIKTVPQRVGSYPKKWNTYRLHQPRSDM